MVIKSCRNCDIIPILEKSISDKNGLDCETVSEWANYIGCETDIRFVSFAIARAGREINKIAHQNTGEYDRIGNNFTHWKDNPHYKVFPKNYKPNNSTDLTKMTTMFSNLNQEIIGKVNMEDREINENLLFNSDLLKLCRKKSPTIKKSLKGYGKLVEDELQLVDMRQVHPAGKEIRNNKTGEVLPKGFQIRSDMLIDTVNRDAIAEDISEKDWSPFTEQIILFLLPEEYKYTNNDGIEVIWGILDGNHRYDAADMQREENIIAWLVKMPVNLIVKYGNAEANRQKNSSKPRSNENIAVSVMKMMDDPTTKLYEDLKKAEESGDKKIDIIEKELEDYHLHANTVPAILRIIIHESKQEICERKDYDSKRRAGYISEFYPEYIKVTGKDWDYETPEGVRVILIESSGSNHIIVAHKICKMQKENNDPISIVFSNAKGDKVTKENRDAIRRKFQTQIYGVIKEMHEGYDKIFDKKTAVVPTFECLPELSDEFDTNKLIRVL